MTAEPFHLSHKAAAAIFIQRVRRSRSGTRTFVINHSCYRYEAFRFGRIVQRSPGFRETFAGSFRQRAENELRIERRGRSRQAIRDPAGTMLYQVQGRLVSPFGCVDNSIFARMID